MPQDLSVSLSVAGVPAQRVTSFRASYEAARPDDLDIDAVFGEYQDPEAVLGQVAELAFLRGDDDPRRFIGVVESVTVQGSQGRGAADRGTHYRLHVVSPIRLLEGAIDTRLFQKMTTREIVETTLDEANLKKRVWRLSSSYPTREYCVQYDESQLAFVTRLCEEEGIYFFTQLDGDDVQLVFADDSTIAAAMPGNATLPHRKRTALGEAGDAVYALFERREVRSGTVTLKDFDWKRPKLDLTEAAKAQDRADLELYDYPGGYSDPDDGKRLAKVRLEEEQVERETLDIEASCTHIAVGTKLSIDETGDLDADYFVFSAVHDYEHHAEGPRYSVRARLVPIAVRYRPDRRTPRPVVYGPQTARVVAPTGSPSETIHTDEHGRCKVKLPWDRAPAQDDTASCWMRVSQPQTSGSMMLARIGWEVLVEYEDGDPDRPLVTGRLYNGLNMPPYALPEGRTRTAIQTMSSPGGAGANEVRFEDRKGAEEIFIHAQHDMRVTVAHDSTTQVGNNETRVVGNDSKLQVGANQDTKITKGSQTTVGGDQTVSVGGNRKLEVNAVSSVKVAGSSSTTIGGNEMEMDGNPLKALLDLAAAKVEQLADAEADAIIKRVQAHVDGAVNQALGPINKLTEQAKKIQEGAEAIGKGDLSAVAPLVAGAAGLPGAGDLGAAMGGGKGGKGKGGKAEGGKEDGGGSSDESNMVAAMARGAAHQAIHSATESAENALGAALGVEGMGGGDESTKNQGGPKGDVAGVDETNRAKGPGHSTAKIGGKYLETVGSNRALATLQAINTNVSGDEKLTVGAAHVTLTIGKYAETAGGSKTETAPALLVLSKGGESEKAKGSKMSMVGGVVYEKIAGSHAIEAKGPATFVSAFNKVEAKTSISFKAGPSSVTIDKDGVTIKSPIVTFLSAKIQATGKVDEV